VIFGAKKSDLMERNERKRVKGTEDQKTIKKVKKGVEAAREREEIETEIKDE
jgi:hypothetical protein